MRTRQPIGGLGKDSAAVELVGARLENGVDDTALEEAFADVVRGNLGLEFADRVDRNRAAARGQRVGVEAEAVADRHTVNGEAVEAGVGAGEGDLASGRLRRVERGERIATDKVANVAVDRCDLRNVVGVEDRGGAVADRAGTLHARSGDYDVLAIVGCGFNREREGLACDRVNVGDLRPALIDRDGVGPAGAQTWQREGTVSGGDCAGASARWHVDCGDGRADNRRTVVGNFALDRRAGFLRACRSRNGERGHGHAKKKIMSHDVAPVFLIAENATVSSPGAPMRLKYFG
ncbi:hypothetical protein D9M73_121380 [compost metagenome]